MDGSCCGDIYLEMSITKEIAKAISFVKDKLLDFNPHGWTHTD